MAQAKPKELPNYIEARNPKELRALCIQNNIRLKMTVQYFDFQKAGNKWYCFYYEPFHQSEEYRILNGTKE